MTSKKRSEQKERKVGVKINIRELIFAYKRKYDGCSPTMRWLMAELLATTGRSLSTSMMTHYVDEIVEENEWSWDESKRVVTKGEWLELTEKEGQLVQLVGKMYHDSHNP